jgi:tetratricopeptide (TPR) repeat protein
VYVLRNSLGLPNWVFGAAVVRLVVGLPIMLATGRKERERVIAASTGTFPVPDTPVTRMLTWRKAILGGGLAFGALAVIVIAYTVMRVTGIGSVGTLQAKGLLKERQPILLAQFDSRSPDTTLAPTLTDAFRVDLSQSQSVKLVDGQQVSDALARMQKPATTTLTPALAIEIAQREGVPAIVSGEIAPVGKSYVLSAKVLSASNSAVLTAVRETATSDADLIPALDRLSRALRERIGESLVSIRADQPLEHVTTGSLEALRRYSQAMRLSDAGREEAAVPVLREATTIDTGFAMAWRKLAILLSNNGGSAAEFTDAARRAYLHRDRLPEMEKQAATASYFNLVDYESDKTIAAYRAMLEIDPQNDIAQNNLAIALSQRGQYAEAESLAMACVNRGQFANCPFHAIRNQLLRGERARAESTWKRWERAAPQDPNMRQVGFGLASWRGDYALAEQHARALAAEETSSKYFQATAQEDLAYSAGVQGKIGQAEQQMRSAASTQESRGALDLYLTDMARLAQFDIRYRNRPADAAAILSEALARHPLSSMQPENRPYSMLAATMAITGQPDEAQRLMAEYAHTVPAGMLKGDMDRFGAQGQIALARGKYAEAIAAFQAQHSDNPCVGCGRFEIAQAFTKLGQADSAIAYYNYDLDTAGTFRVFGDAINLAATYQRLGELYESKGDRKRAVESYEKLIALWKNADPELQPIVKDAKERVARLSGEH